MPAWSSRLAMVGLAGLACGPNAGGEPMTRTAYGEAFTLGLGEGAEVGGDYRVRFVRVSEDSRCPVGVQCVQAGNAAAELAVESDRGSATLTLHTGREPRSATAMGGELDLIEVLPPPAVDADPDSIVYQATLVVRSAP